MPVSVFIQNIQISLLEQLKGTANRKTALEAVVPPLLDAVHLYEVIERHDRAHCEAVMLYAN